ncbi:hypothetical protein LPJ56_004447, partial [Coemansia sp. RSA 2599]
NVQELRLSLQEGREFGKARVGQKQAEAVQVTKHAIDGAKGAVKKLEGAVLEKAAAVAKESVESVAGVVDAKKHESVVKAAPAEEPKKQLPIGFKEKTDN